MNCRDWIDPIALHAGGNLSRDDAVALEAHLRTCPDCRSLLEELVANRKALRRFAEHPLPEHYLARLRPRILDEIEHTTNSRRRFRAPRWMVVAAGLIAALLGAWLWVSPRPASESGESTVQLATPLPEGPHDVPMGAPRDLAGRESETPRVTPDGARGATDPTAGPTGDLRARAHSDSATRAPSAQRMRASGLAWTLPASGPLAADPTLVVLPEGSEPLRDSDSLVVLPSPTHAPPSDRVVAIPVSTDPLSDLVEASVEPGAVLAPGMAVLLDLTVLNDDDQPTLRKLFQSTQTTVYWLDPPNDPLEEHEDVDTKVL